MLRRLTQTSKLPFGDMAHIGLSYDFDLEISQALFWVFKSVKSARFTALSNAWVTARNNDWVTAPKRLGQCPRLPGI